MPSGLLARLTTLRKHEYGSLLQVPTLLGVVASVGTTLPTRTAQLPTSLAQRCWKLLRPFAGSFTQTSVDMIRTDYKPVTIMNNFFHHTYMLLRLFFSLLLKLKPQGKNRSRHMARLTSTIISTKLFSRTKSVVLVLGFIILSANLYLLQTLSWSRTQERDVQEPQGTNVLQTLSWSRTQERDVQEPQGTNIKQTMPVTTRKRVSVGGLNESCLQKMTEVNRGILHFKNITIRPPLGHAKVLQVKLEHPQEEDEFFQLQRGFFTLYCDRDINQVKENLHQATINNVLSSWGLAVEVIIPWTPQLIGTTHSFNTGHYLAIQRVEYANVYWTVIDLMDIFITTQVVGIAPESLNIVLMDAHPPTSLDPFWSVVFSKLIKLGNDSLFTNSSRVVFENLLWRYPRAYCPLLDRNVNTLKYVQPFREYVLQRFGIPVHARPRNCSEHKIKVLFNFRRDYHSHPRNLDGTVDRKIANEKDVLKEMEENFPNITIVATQLDSLNLKTQLELVSSADIFFGMHGAAHAFPIFMPPGGAVVEMFNFNSNNWHMGKIAALSGHSHVVWVSTDAKAYNQRTRSTTIPPGVVKELLGKAIKKICD